MSMKCPECGAWTSVKETRTRKIENITVRRYECANLHRFTTEEIVKDELLRRVRELQSGPRLPSKSGKSETAIPETPRTDIQTLRSPTTEGAGEVGAPRTSWVAGLGPNSLLALAGVKQGAVAK